MAPKKRDLTDAEWHVLHVATRKSLEKIFKAHKQPPVLPYLVVRILPGGHHVLGGARAPRRRG